MILGFMFWGVGGSGLRVRKGRLRGEVLPEPVLAHPYGSCFFGENALKNPPGGT